EGVVGTGGDATHIIAKGSDHVQRNAPAGGDAPDLVRGSLREPEGVVGTSRDIIGGVGRALNRDLVLRDPPAGGDAPDLFAPLREPEGAVGASRDPMRRGVA